MRARLAALVLMLSSGVVMAQPGQTDVPPGPPPAPAPAPNALPPLPPAPSVWHRFRLTDGRELDARIVGGDQASYYIQTTTGTFSLARTMVVSMTPIPSAPPPSPLSVAPPAPPKPEPTRSRAAGVGLFAGTYLLTVLIARGRKGSDPDASLGYIPLVGPLVWTASDSGNWGEDGFDWLALLDSLMQGIGAYGMVAGLEDKQSSRTGIIGVNTVHTDEMRGFAVTGRF